MPRYIYLDGSTAIADVLDGDGRAQSEAIWHYLLSLSGSRNPSGD